MKARLARLLRGPSGRDGFIVVAVLTYKIRRLKEAYGVKVCVHVRAHACMCMCACVCVCVRVCALCALCAYVHACACMRACGCGKNSEKAKILDWMMTRAKRLSGRIRRGIVA